MQPLGVSRSYLLVSVVRKTPSTPTTRRYFVTRKDQKRLGNEFRKMVRTRIPRCEASGQGNKRCGGVLQCSHIISVGAKKNLELHPWNATTMCYAHHFYWWPKSPTLSGDWVKSYLGKWYTKLDAIKDTFTTKTWTPEEVKQFWRNTKGWW